MMHTIFLRRAPAALLVAVAVPTFVAAGAYGDAQASVARDLLALAAIGSALLAVLGAVWLWRSMSRLDRSRRELADEQALRRAAEARHKAAERRTLDFFESMTDGVVVIDEHARVTVMNRAAARMFEIAPAAAFGRAFQDLFVTRGAPKQARGGGVVRQALQGAGMISGVEAIRADGTRFPVEISVAEYEIDAKRAFGCVVRDITERERVERAKNEFLALVSHELRTPVTSMRGALGALTEGFAGRLPDDVRHMVDIAYRNCERLAVLVNDIIDLERLSSDRMTISLAPFNLEAALHEAISGIESYEPARAVRVVMQTSPSTAHVFADRSRTLQIAANLLSNAIKFSSPQSSVEVSIARARDAWRVAVRDHGPGVPEAFRDKLFERFSQAQSPDTRARGGSGLGLSIAHGLVERMDGRIGMTRPPGGGSIFWFELPAFHIMEKNA